MSLRVKCRTKTEYVNVFKKVITYKINFNAQLFFLVNFVTGQHWCFKLMSIYWFIGLLSCRVAKHCKRWIFVKNITTEAIQNITDITHFFLLNGSLLWNTSSL